MKKLFLAVSLVLAAATPALAKNNDGFLKGKVLRIDMKDAIAERGNSTGLDISLPVSIPGISASTISLLSVEQALVKAADDDDIAMIYLNYDNFSAPMALREEVREYLRRFSEKGKPIIAYGCSLGEGSYYIASVADRVFLNPKGGGTLKGLSTTQYFVKDLLDTLGVEVQLIRHGKFKSAGEMYIRNDISEENRRQYEAILNATWDTMTEEMALSRGLPADSLKIWASNLSLGVASTWVEKGLVDGLKYKDEMEQYICHLFGTTDPSKVERINLKDYAKKASKGGSGDKIAILYANGEISRDGNEVAGAAFAAQVAKLREDSSIKAVVFRVNSPGGEVVAADMIRREIELLAKEKPVIASYGSAAASGGYLISAGCERIFVDNTTLTGSIGVFGLIPSYGDAVHKVFKVRLVNVGTEPHSGLGSGVKPLTQEEQDWYQKEIEGIYTDFVNVVCEGRKMSFEEVDEIAQGRVWSGKDALLIGLADERGTLLDAVEYAAKKAELKKYKIVTAPGNTSALGKTKKKAEPLVIVEEVLEPGFKAMARMPRISLEPFNPEAL